MKVAIIGTGHIANVHAQELKKLGHDIDVAIDNNLETAKTFSKKWNVRQPSDDVNDAFQKDIDVIHICTPPVIHFDLIQEAIKNGKHVICEKPLTLDSKESNELVTLGEKSDVVVAVNYNVRYHKSLGKIKELIQSDAFGQVRLINASYMQEFHILPTNYSWRYDSRTSGNLRAISEIGSHVIDIITYLTNQKIKSVSSMTKNYVPIRHLKDSVMYEEKVSGSEEVEVTNEDAAIISFQLENGAIGNITLSEISHGKTNEINLHIDGAAKSVWWSNEKPYHTNIGNNEAGVVIDVDSFGGGYTDTFSSFFEAVYSDITNNQRNEDYPTLIDGHYNTRVCEAILESSKKNSKWIEIN